VIMAEEKGQHHAEPLQTDPPPGPTMQSFSFSCFYQGNSSLAFSELIDIKVKSVYKDFPGKIKDGILVSLKSIVQYKFFSSRDSNDEVETNWFSVVLKKGDSEPQIFQSSCEDYELVPFCLPVVMSVKCCIKGSQAKFWKIEAIGAFYFDTSVPPPGRCISISQIPDRYARTPTRPPRSADGRKSLTIQELSSLYPAISPPRFDSPSSPSMARKTIGIPRPLMPASVSTSILTNDAARILIMSVIADVSLFAAYTLEHEKRDIVQKFTHRTAYKGDILIHQGEPGSYFYVIQSGVVGIYFEFNSSLEKVHELREGCYFGDKELQHQTVTAYSAIAEDECVLWRISGSLIKTDTDIVIDFG
jgi:hypothetical protein